LPGFAQYIRNTWSSKKNIVRFKKTHVPLNEIYLLPGLLIPVSQETTIFIVREELKKTQVIKRILNRKKETFVNNKGQTKHIAPPLRSSGVDRNRNPEIQESGNRNRNSEIQESGNPNPEIKDTTFDDFFPPLKDPPLND
jgi:hypothetical protein|tara:strand:- start:896 stop:1315 length:420 start_codon:yes stop_codon:yes gene_type:complete